MFIIHFYCLEEQNTKIILQLFDLIADRDLYLSLFLYTGCATHTNAKIWKCDVICVKVC